MVKVLDAQAIEAMKTSIDNDLETFAAMMDLFKMYADATRLKILHILSKTDACSVNDLSKIMGMSQSAISHQLSSLRKSNLVKYEKVGLNVFYSLADDHVMSIFKQAFDHVLEDF
jgi:ArsR family transcriptional regulator, lead/cadmium/zinc/bismuth-responsive transcriptional repressor